MMLYKSLAVVCYPTMINVVVGQVVDEMIVILQIHFGRMMSEPWIKMSYSTNYELCQIRVD